MIELDTRITLFLNNLGCESLDGAVLMMTKTTPWIPFFVLLLYFLWKQLGWKRTLAALVGTALCVLICDQFSAHVCKPYFHRLRPTHTPELEGLVRVVNGYRAGYPYGFFSSHAANTFGIATFLSFVFRKRVWTGVLFAWAFVCTATRVYLGVHYFGDVLVGALFGMLVGGGIAYLYSKFHNTICNE